MTVFSTFFRVSKKYIGSIILYSAIFLSIVLLVVQDRVENPVEDFAATTVKVAVFDHDNSDLSKGMITFLRENHEVVEIEEELDVIRDKMYQRAVAYVITIPEGFGAEVAKGEGENSLEVYKLPGSIASQFMDLSISTFLSTYSGYLAAELTPQEAYEKTLETISLQTEVAFYSGEEVQGLPPVHYFYMYLPYALISVLVLAIGPIFMAFNNGQMKRRMLCSRVSSLKKNVSLVLASGVYTLVIVLLYFAISVFLYKADAVGLAGMLRLMNVFVHAFVCLALAFLFSMLTAKSELLNMFTNVFGLGSCFLCGVFVPREWLSDSVAAIGRFLPAYWYINVEDAISNLDTTVTSTITTGYLIQVLYAVAVLIIAMVLSQYKRKE